MSGQPEQPERVIHFADETTSGERCASLRGLRRITIAAKCSADDSFEWLRRFNHDYLGDAGEIKSDLVLAVMDQSRAARDKVLAEVAGATIAIIDLAENTPGERFIAEDLPDTEEKTMERFLSDEVEEALKSLPARDARVLRLYFGLDGGREHTLEEIGGMLGVTRERVRQLRDRALKRLREGEVGKALASFAA